MQIKATDLSVSRVGWLYYLHHTPHPTPHLTPNNGEPASKKALMIIIMTLKLPVDEAEMVERFNGETSWVADKGLVSRSLPYG